MTATSIEQSLRTRLRRWLDSVPGRLLCETGHAAVAGCLPNLFGYHIVQIGGYDDRSLLAASRIGHRIEFDVDGSGAAAAALRCAASALPIAPDSVDVAVLPHVLEFEADPHQVLREVERILIPEGHVVILGFNPWSLWGLWRLAHAWRAEPPWAGRFYSLARVKDWLRVLGFDIESGYSVCFRPPFGGERLQRRLAFMERLGAYCWPGLGAAWCVVGRKRLMPMTPTRARWKMRRSLIAAGLAEPSTRVASSSGNRCP